MAFSRTAIPDFALDNVIYAGAVVTVYTVDVNGDKTATLATLYDAVSGAGTLANPQTLDSQGKNSQPLYIDQPVIMEITGLGAGVPNQTTGIVGTNLLSDAVSDAQAAAAQSITFAALARASKNAAAASAGSLQVPDGLTIGGGDALKMPRVNVGETAYELRTPTQVRADLSLGTAALKNTGSSGNTIPILNVANVWAAIQTFTLKAVFSAGLTLAGILSAADQIIERAKLKDYSETFFAIGSSGGGTQDFDLEDGNVQSVTVDTSTNTFTTSNWPADGDSGSLTLIITNGGSQTVVWPAAVDWVGSAAPALTAAGVDVVVLMSQDAGVTILGFKSGLDFG